MKEDGRRRVDRKKGVKLGGGDGKERGREGGRREEMKREGGG